MQVISNVALISINETLIVQVITFLIFLFIINRMMFRPLQNVMSKRESHLEKLKQEIMDASLEIEKYSNQMDEQQSEIRKEALALNQELEELGNQKSDEILDATREEVAMLRRKTEQMVEEKISEAKRSFRKEAESLALNIMEKIVDRRLDG